MSRPHIVIVGGGFAGLAAVDELDGADVDITLIDRKNHHVFQPLLYQVATAGLNPADIAYPIRSIVRAQENVRVVLDTVVDIDPTRSMVTLAEDGDVSFDTLILAAGATHSYFGNDDWERDAPGLKTVEDALEIRRRVLTAFEEAERSESEAERRAWLTFVVVGAGPTGVEMAGAIAEIAIHTLRRDFRTIDPSTARVLLLEGSDRVLGTFAPKLSRKARQQLERHGVEVRTSALVTDLDSAGVTVGDERIDARTIVWGAGVAGSPLGALVGAPVDRSGRVEVGPDLAVADHPNVLVIGDLAAATTDGKPVPGVAPAAMQGGRHAALVVKADLAGDPRPEFRYRDKGSLATIGRSAAVAEFGNLRVTGFMAWVLWWAVHVAFLVDFRSRTMVMFGWGWSWMTFQRGARLITTPWSPSNSEPHP